MIFKCYSEDKKIHLKLPLPGSFHFKENNNPVKIRILFSSFLIFSDPGVLEPGIDMYGA